MTIIEVAMRRLRDSSEMAATVLELADRWTRAYGRMQSADHTFGLHDQGRMEGYVQAIQLMLGLSHAETLDMLKRGLLSP